MDSALFLLILSFLWTSSSGDTEVSCVFMESCVLPCSFQGKADIVIHWTPPKHSHESNQVQLQLQDGRFRGRTSLFQDQLSSGNASLLLTGVNVEDQGRYRCQTNTDAGEDVSFVSLKVHAPVKTVSIDQAGNRITCSSEGVYPMPELTWSTDPPGKVLLGSTTLVQATERHLYNISSSLPVSDSDGALNYSCNVSTPTSSRTATIGLHPSTLAEDRGRGIGLVVGVILVTGSMCLVPLLLLKCSEFWKKRKSVQPDILSREKTENPTEGNTKGADFDEESCLRTNIPSQPTKKPNKCKLYIKMAGDKLNSSLRN
ncbi:unnamed protein product [Menidia menidia]|uniref:(Atlantic silverside) hypothetical protein n=1 Tax=Menidia menidia TaxID=238744 RepID=A0A8S4ANV4_9TELE|nr:unnamed protein product [Menidia menidia]